LSVSPKEDRKFSRVEASHTLYFQVRENSQDIEIDLGKGKEGQISVAKLYFIRQAYFHIVHLILTILLKSGNV
jgi:hypothetical protein